VEYYPPTATGTGLNQDIPDSLHCPSSSSEGEVEEEGRKGLWPRRGKNKTQPARISDELAELGYYVRSMKPRKGWLHQRKDLANAHQILL
jgi:phosphatidylinositol phospholipase C delta